MLNKFPPEILQNIFQELVEHGNKTLKIQQQFYHDLYNCLFVNHYWFSNAIILLWQNTLRTFYKKNFITSKILINTYISSLSKESKEILYKENIIDSKQKSIITLCNYGSLLKNLNFTELYNKLIYWMLIMEEKQFDIEILEKIDPDMIVAYHANDIISERNRNLVYKELFKLFTTNSTNLKYQLKLRDNMKSIGIITNYSHLKNLSISLLLNLETLECHTNVPTKVYKDLSQLISTIDRMKIKFNNDKENEELINFISGLKKIKIMKIEIYQFNNYNYYSKIIENSLNITSNYQIVIPSNIYIPINFSMIFNKIIGLEIHDSINSIDIVKSWNEFEFLPFITKLKFSSNSLIEIDLELYSNIIKKTNKNLIELSISISDGFFHNSENLFNTISTYCPKLKTLDLKIKRKILFHIPLIFQSCMNLKKINLDIKDDKDITKLIYYIGKVIPKNLKYFFIYQDDVNWDIKCFNTFLNFCENNSIKNLLIKYKYKKSCGNRNEYKKIIWKFVNRGVLNRYSNIKKI
ncbi:hypothetical protein C1645_875872 [Glomus cerebriforme]|uniref:F-box domain-containing protein n=1 Tax=Glomus cerebriforme TaxID=658196 RepID=A0A397SX44_9GLOM|nr:hypothetical protein C1645_875872 [Glomus cerebriforme]